MLNASFDAYRKAAIPLFAAGVVCFVALLGSNLVFGSFDPSRGFTPGDLIVQLISQVVMFANIAMSINIAMQVFDGKKVDMSSLVSGLPWGPTAVSYVLANLFVSLPGIIIGFVSSFAMPLLFLGLILFVTPVLMMYAVTAAMHGDVSPVQSIMTSINLVRSNPGHSFAAAYLLGGLAFVSITLCIVPFFVVGLPLVHFAAVYLYRSIVGHPTTLAQ